MKIERHKTGWVCQLPGETEWRRFGPITFTAANAQKVHDGTKTQTRRLLNPQPPPWARYPQESGAGFHFTDRSVDADDLKFWPLYEKEIAPRYRVGDVRYVQEPWRVPTEFDHLKPTLLTPGGRYMPIRYEGDGRSECGDCGKLRPARFMPGPPKRFWRTVILVTGVIVERLQGITRRDVIAEGVELLPPSSPLMADVEARDRFKELWNSIHAEPGTRWEDNPWVWVYAFISVNSNEA